MPRRHFSFSKPFYLMLPKQPFLSIIKMKHADIRKRAVALRIIKSEPDHDLIRNLKSGIIHRHIDLTAVRLIKKRAKLNRSRLTAS